MRDIKNIIKRLLYLSEVILDEFDVLANLSYHNHENSKEFNKHVDTIASYLNSEKVILNNLSIEEIKEIYITLPEYDNDSDEFDRCSENISNRFAEYIDNDEDYVDDKSITIDDEDEEEEEEDITDKYIMEIDETTKDTMKIVNSMATSVIKKMLNRIDGTFADNKGDEKFKKRLMRYFKKFKYYYFKLDIELEHLGINYRFDIDKIPTPTIINRDHEAIYNNECITLLERLYKYKYGDFDLENVSFALFNMMLFDEFSQGLSDESANNLLELCKELENKHGDSITGSLAKKRLVRKKN